VRLVIAPEVLTSSLAFSYVLQLEECVVGKVIEVRANELQLHRAVHPSMQKELDRIGFSARELSRKGWELFIVVPIISLTALIPGI
jgi:hypothetical protein